MNPYDFVPLGIPSPRKPPRGHDVLGARGDNPRSVNDARSISYRSADGYAHHNQSDPPGEAHSGPSLKGMLRERGRDPGRRLISLSGNLYPRGRYDYQRRGRTKQLRPMRHYRPAMRDVPNVRLINPRRGVERPHRAGRGTMGGDWRTAIHVLQRHRGPAEAEPRCVLCEATEDPRTEGVLPPS